MSSYQRKDYQSLLDGSLALTTFSEQAEGEPQEETRTRVLTQRPHRDHQTAGPGLEYFFLGNGLIQAAVQHSTVPTSGTTYGLLLMDPEHFARKSSSFLYHPESGLERTMVTVIVKDRVCYPTSSSLELHWEYPASVPTVVATWRAGRCRVREELWCPVGVPVLVRRVRVTNTGALPVDVQVQAMLYPNPMLFDEQSALEERRMLEAHGYLKLQLYALEDARVHDRWVTSSVEQLGKGVEFSTTFVYRLGDSQRRLSKRQADALRKKSSQYWKSTFEFRAKGMLDHLFQTAKNGLYAAISSTGKMDSSIWQYNLEWVRDQSMVVVGLVLSGQEKLAKTLLDRMMDKMVNDEGVTLESGRWRGYDFYELDQNGELLYAHWMYWRWTDDDSLIEKHW
ncbi:MAG: hypothetical protein AABZ61_03600, partial [Bacteroidota bacterium]